ncbi:MAG: preprotein translocase subunit SecG [Dehalococcoidia bacterium]|nr:preprotein translocase subunit SecG [Dehalococcoidia bacterium]
MVTYFNIAQIILAVVLTLIILLQAKGSGFSGVFSSDTSVFRTRRGVEKVLFQLTIFLAVLFVLLSMVNVRLAQA